MEEEIKKKDWKNGKYAKVWVEKFAPEEDKFTIQKQLPVQVRICLKSKGILGKSGGRIRKKMDRRRIPNSNL